MVGGQLCATRRRGAGRRWLTVSCDDVPCCRIERYRSQRKEERRFGCVDEGTAERHDCYVVVEDNRAPRHSCMAENFTYLSPLFIHHDTPTFTGWYWAS